MAGDERTDNGHRPMPEDPQANPEQAVDALEQRVLGHTVDPTREDEQENTTPAIEQDLDLQDQGSPEASTEPAD